MTLVAALLCEAGLRRHRPERVATAAGFGWRCADCGCTAATELELLDGDDTGYVDPGRVDQYQRMLHVSTGERAPED